MCNIILIDDDYASEILADTLRCRGFRVQRYPDATTATAALDEVAAADLVILDLIMGGASDGDVTQTSDNRIAGISVLHAIRARNASLPVIVFSASTDSAVRDALGGVARTTFVSKWSSPSISEFLCIVEAAIGKSIGDVRPQSFIVHGHDEVAKLARDITRSCG